MIAEKELETLYEEVKGFLCITYEIAESTAARIRAAIKSSIIAINNYGGNTYDYSKEGLHKDLLLNRILYDWNYKLSEFENDYAKEIVRLKLTRDIERQEESENAKI